MNTFRHPGTIRLFTTIGMIILATSFLNNFLIEKSINQLKNCLYIVGIVLLLFITYLFFTKRISDNVSFAFADGSPKEKLDRISFYTICFFEGLLQIFFIVSLLYFLLKKKLQKLTITIPILFTINSIIFCWAGQPFTFISQIKTSTVNQFLSSAPKGYPKKGFQNPIHSNSYFTSGEMAPYGYKKFYEKKITIHDLVINPTMNKNYQSFLSSTELRKYFDAYLPAYIADIVVGNESSIFNTSQKIVVADSINHFKTYPNEIRNEIVLLNFGPNHLTFSIKNQRESVFTLFQQYNHNWEAKINKIPTQIYKANIAFIAVIIPAGNNTLKFTYNPIAVKRAIILSLVTLFILLTLLF